MLDWNSNADIDVSGAAPGPFTTSGQFDTATDQSDWFNGSGSTPIPDSEPFRLRYGMAATVTITAIAAVLSVTTAAGNLLVIAAFHVDVQLQRVSNYFLLSLAVADFAIGLVSMPLFTLYLLLGRWPLGAVVCDAWLSLDYTVSNASVANLLLISFDRYMCVTRPLNYRVRRTPRCAVAMIVSAWIISALLWTPWIVAWPFIDGERKVEWDQCYIQFLNTNPGITISTAVAAFYVPVTAMCVLYGRIYSETKRRRAGLVSLQAHCGHHAATSSLRDDDSSDNDMNVLPSTCQALQPYSEELRQLYEAALRQQKQLPRQRQQKLQHQETGADDDNQSTTTTSTSTTAGDGFWWRYCWSRRSDAGSVNVRGESAKPGNRRGRGSDSERIWTSRRECESSGSCSDIATVSNSGSFVTPATSLSCSLRRHPSINRQTDGSSTDLPDVVVLEPSDCRQHRQGQAKSNSDEMSSTASHSTRTNGSFRRRSGRFNRALTVRMITEEGEAVDEMDAGQRQDVEDPPVSAALTPAPSNASTREKEDQEGSTRLAEHGSRRRSSISTDISYASSVSEVTERRRRSSYDSAISVAARDDTPPQYVAVSEPPPPSVGRRLTETAETLMFGMQARITSRVTERTRAQRAHRRRQERRQEQKAAKTLSAILLAFIITWTPYNLFTIIQTFCTDCVHEHLYEFGYWLCYINSTINPILYALCNATFRRTYWRIVTCRWRRRRLRPRHQPRRQ